MRPVAPTNGNEADLLLMQVTQLVITVLIADSNVVGNLVDISVKR
jgi:hypothetical protein